MQITKDNPELKATNFSTWNCEELLYRITITHDKFDYPAFLKAVDRNPDTNEWDDILCPSVDSDYHVHIGWRDERKIIRIQIGYYATEHKAHLVPEKFTPAEDVVGFIGKFFKNENAQAHIHAEFKFSRGKQSRFPLPIKTAVGPFKVEVDGIGMQLPELPCGIAQIWLEQGKKDLGVQIIGDRKVTFDRFSVFDDIKEILSVIESITEDKR